MNNRDVTIVGGGLAGSLLAIYLAKAGFNVEVFERRKDPRQGATNEQRQGEGRSINLALSVRGLHALSEVGLDAEVRKRLIPMKGRMLHSIDGKLAFARYGRNDSEVINSISRHGLNQLLLESLSEFKNVRTHFDSRCLGYDFASSELLIQSGSDQKLQRLVRKPVIGTDGAASAIRTSMLGQGRFDFSQSYLEHGYKELTIPPTADGQFRIEPNALHIWPRGGYMMIALPNLDRSFTCTLFFPHVGKKSFASLTSPSAVRELFEHEFQDASQLITDLEQEFFRNPTGNLATIKCWPWFVGDQVLLLGDAAHAIVPFYGQGMNCAFEDCSALHSLCCQDTEWGQVFAELGRARKENCDAIAQLALDNFIEMRDTSAKPEFLIKKALEHALEEAYPGEFISKYSMVSFHRVPYAMALNRGRIQDQILMETCSCVESAKEVDLHKLHAKIQSALESASNTPG